MDIVNQPPNPAPLPRKPSRFWFWLALFAIFCLAASLLGNLVLGVGLLGKLGAQTDDSLKSYKSTVVDGNAESEDFIAVVPIQGVIMEAPGEGAAVKGSVTTLVSLLKALRNKPHLKALLLQVDSPGGGVTASDRMYHELMRFKAETHVPIVAIFEDVAASGGYYVAMSADYIMAHNTSVTGSIGVISHFYNMSELMDKVGVKVNTIKSLNFEGKESFKDIGSPYRPMRAEEKKLLQGVISEMWERFVGVVSEGRKGKMDPAKIREMADGRVFTGPQALKLNLIDGLGYSEDAYAKVRELSKSPEAKIVRFYRERGWEEFFGMQSNLRGELAKQLLPLNLTGPSFMYLWSGH